MPKETFFNLPPQKREAIVAVAIEEFSDNDYKNVSITRMVQRTGIAKGSFYQYFADKKDLYLYLIELVAQEKARVLQSYPPPEPNMGIFAYLRWMMRAGLSFEFANPRLAQIGYRAIYGDAPLPQETLAVVKDGAMHYFRGLVMQGIEQGVVDPDVDPEVAAFMFNAVFTSLGDYMLRSLDIPSERLLELGGKAMETPEVQQIFEDVIMILERGLGPQ